MENIKDHVITYPDRPNLMMRYRDPESGKQIARSTGTNRRDAERAAAKWEAELREGRYNKPTKTTWEEFREQFDRNVLAVERRNRDDIRLHAKRVRAGGSAWQAVGVEHDEGNRVRHRVAGEGVVAGNDRPPFADAEGRGRFGRTAKGSC